MDDLARLFNNATEAEIWWTTATVIGIFLHGYLAIQAWFDLYILYSLGAEKWRLDSARWYFLGQAMLCIPRLLGTMAGVLAMMIPNSTNPEIRELQVIIQTSFIVAEWLSAATGGMFWMARRVLRIHHREASGMTEQQEIADENESSRDERDRAQRAEGSGQ
jgi:hypothetical protein